MGHDFSFENVRRFAQGFANYILNTKSTRTPRILLSYDTRQLSYKFAHETARIFSLNGIMSFIPQRDAPMAAISLAITRNRLDGGVVFTASFNKPIYNGIKLLDRQGAPALPSVSSLVETEIKAIGDSFEFKPEYAREELIDRVSVRTPYIKHIEGHVNFGTIRDANMKIIVDNLFGASRDYLDFILNENDIQVDSIHNLPYASSGKVIPYCGPESLTELAKLVVESKADIGIATDIDGDRFGIVDSTGRYIDSNTIVPPLIEYLITVRKMEGGIVKSISTTNNIRNVADFYSRKVFVTPVGFKYLAHMLALRKTFMAVESSNGVALRQSTLIKDGILFNLLVVEMLAYYKVSLETLLKTFYNKFPRLFSREVAVGKTRERTGKLSSLIKEKPMDLGGFPVRRISLIDGIKFIMENSWLLIRESGTSNVIRIYAESSRLKETNELIKKGRSFIEKN